jgi:hypothetical protein
MEGPSIDLTKLRHVEESIAPLPTTPGVLIVTCIAAVAFHVFRFGIGLGGNRSRA